VTGPSYLSVLAALGAVVALVMLSRRVLLMLPRALTSGGLAGRAGPLAVEQVLALDVRRRVLLLRCGERRLLLLTGGPQDVMLGWVEPPTAKDAP
jgi:flagellar protein FliO/FliZ